MSMQIEGKYVCNDVPDDIPKDEHCILNNYAVSVDGKYVNICNNVPDDIPKDEIGLTDAL